MTEEEVDAAHVELMNEFIHQANRYLKKWSPDFVTSAIVAAAAAFALFNIKQGGGGSDADIDEAVQNYVRRIREFRDCELVGKR